MKSNLSYAKPILITASISGGLAVALGAFGAHGLKKIISPEMIDIFNKGVYYQFIHTFALLACGILVYLTSEKRFLISSRFFVAGIACFSGSLYLLSFKEILDINTKLIGPITPLGGLFFISGWIMLFTGVIRLKN